MGEISSPVKILFGGERDEANDEVTARLPIPIGCKYEALQNRGKFCFPQIRVAAKFDDARS